MTTDADRKQTRNGTFDPQHMARQADDHWSDDSALDEFVRGWTLIGIGAWVMLAGAIGYAAWLTWGQ